MFVYDELSSYCKGNKSGICDGEMVFKFYFFEFFNLLIKYWGVKNKLNLRSEYNCSVSWFFVYIV